MHKCLKIESSFYLSSKILTVSSLPERKTQMSIARVRANTILGNKRFEVATPIL